MSKLQLSIAIGDYDRVRPLSNGSVQIDGVDPIFQFLEPEEIFFRAFRFAEFDACELSLSSFVLRMSRGDCPYVGVPVFPSRAFRHNAFVVRRNADIRSPADLRGRRVGTPEYQLTAHVWARAILTEDYGVEAKDIVWVQGGLEEAGRIEKNELSLKPEIRLEPAPPGRSLSALLVDGAIDAVLAPRAPSVMSDPAANIGYLFDDPVEVAKEWFGRTRIFPIMHVLGIRRDLAERHRWLPRALLKAFTAAKDIAVARLSVLAAPSITLPFVGERVAEARKSMGDDYWCYGLGENRETLEYFLKHHDRQGLAAKKLAVEDLFDSATVEQFRI